MKNFKKNNVNLSDRLKDTKLNPSMEYNKVFKVFNILIKGNKVSIKKITHVITPITQINSKDVGNLISTHGIIVEVNEIETVLMDAVYECRSCMRLYTIHQKSKNEKKPTKCYECGGTSFRLLKDESKFDDYQEITLQEIINYKNKKRILAVLRGEIVEYNKYKENDVIQLNAKVKVEKEHNRYKLFLDVENIDLKEITILKKLKKSSKKSVRKREISNTPQAYKDWRSAVLKMDSYTCQKCHIKYKWDNENLHAHHILSYSVCEEVRLDPDNGITLCINCHKDFHKKYGKTNNNRYQLEEFLEYD